MAQTSNYSQFGRNAESLLQLGPASGGGQPGPAAADLISPDLATGQKSGYIFTVTPTKEGYAITAVPQVFGQSGRRTFYSDQTLVVRENWGAEPATAQSNEIK